MTSIIVAPFARGQQPSNLSPVIDVNTSRAGFVPMNGDPLDASTYDRAFDGPKDGASTEEGFETPGTFPPDCWTQIDADGDGMGWFHYQGPGTAHSGVFSAASASWYLEALTPDNYLVSPQLNIGTGESLSFFIAAQDTVYFQEHYGVYVSTTGNSSAADFTDELLTETLSDTAWTQHTLDMSAYAGQDVYIAFRHFGVSDQFYIKLDDITLPGEPAPCVVCDFPILESQSVGCSGPGWTGTLVLNNLPEGASYTLSNSVNSDTESVDANDSYEMGPFDNGTTVDFILTDTEQPTCAETIATLSGDCTEPCMDYLYGPYLNFVNMGIPGPDSDGNCDTIQIQTFEVQGGESYLFSDLPGESNYTFSACDGPGAGTYPISYTVFDSLSGDVVASGNNGDDCSISWETGEGGTFLVAIAFEGYCGMSVPVDNGYPSITCSGPLWVADILKVETKIYPNPTTGVVRLATPLSGRADIVIFDGLWRVVARGVLDLGAELPALDVSDLVQGVYTLRIDTDNGTTTTKFVKMP